MPGIPESSIIPEPFEVDECPTPQFHLPDRLCGNCLWRPYMHPDFVPRFQHEHEQLREWKESQRG